MEPSLSRHQAVERAIVCSFPSFANFRGVVLVCIEADFARRSSFCSICLALKDLRTYAPLQSPLQFPYLHVSTVSQHNILGKNISGCSEAPAHLLAAISRVFHSAGFAKQRARSRHSWLRRSSPASATRKLRTLPFGSLCGKAASPE